MIHTNRIVTVGEQESIIDRPIVLYRGDREVEIEFTLVGNEFTFSEEGNVIKSVNASHGQLVLNTPSGEHMFSELAECHEGKVVFVVTKEMIDEFVEMGFYSFQIRLYDSAEMKSRVTIPPVLSGFDIRNPIAAEDETNVVDQGIVDYARIFKDQSNEELPTFDWTGAYNKTEWVHHDVITENKMNKIEDALYSINANIKESDVVMLNALDQVKKDADKYVKEHMAEVEADVEEFERSLNTDVQQFKIDTNAAMTAHKNEVSEELESVNSQLTDIVQEFNIDKFQDLINEYTNNDKVLNIKKGNYEIDKQIIIPGNCKINFNGSTITRKSGSGVYDMFLCVDNSNVSISNLKIDGNRNSDNLVKETAGHRFSGIKLKNVSNSKLENIDVVNTVNAENHGSHKASGIYFENCTDIECNNINGSYNDGTAIYIDSSKVKINTSYTHDNEGSGISSIYADDSEYYFIKSINNGYSNLSVNGKRSKVANVESIGSAYSGVNIGHENIHSDDTQVCNVYSSNNGYEGLTISDSVNVQIINFVTEENKRNNIRIFINSDKCSLLNITSRNSQGGQGMLIETGKHYIDSSRVYNNAKSGIYIGSSAEIKIGDSVECYNNGQVTSLNSAGVILANSKNCEIGSISCYDNQSIKTQESGIWVAGGDNHKLALVNCYDNLSYQIRQTSSPNGLNILNWDSSVYTATNFSNNWSGFLRYSKNINGDTIIVGKLKGGDIGKSAFTLPDAFKPISTMNYPSVLSDRSIGVVTISSAGDIILYSQLENDINIYLKN